MPTLGLWQDDLNHMKSSGRCRHPRAAEVLSAEPLR